VPSTNATGSSTNTTSSPTPDITITVPTTNMTGNSANQTLPANTTGISNTTGDATNMSNSTGLVNATLPHANATGNSTNQTMPSSNATALNANATGSSTNQANSTMPGVNSTAGNVNANQTMPGSNATAGGTNSSGSSIHTSFTVVDLQDVVPAGSEVLLQLNATGISFVDLTSAGTGWELIAQHPDGTMSSFGFLQAWSVDGEPPDTVYTWMTQPAIYLPRVRLCIRDIWLLATQAHVAPNPYTSWWIGFTVRNALHARRGSTRCMLAAASSSV
jgi:hypothetical protein